MHSVSTNISKRLKIARIANGYKTAKDFATQHDIPNTTYSQHESGKRALSVENLCNYASLLNIEPSWLMIGQGYPCNQKEAENLELRIFQLQDEMASKGEIDLSATPFIEWDKKLSFVNIELLQKILNELLPLLKTIPDKHTKDAVDFCFDLYNKLISIQADGEEKEKLVRICIDSFFKGIGSHLSSDVSKKVASMF